MDPAFVAARQSFDQLGGPGALRHDTATAGPAAVWQQQLGRDLSLDELHLLKRLASDGVGGNGNIGNSHVVNGYGESAHGHRNAPLADTNGNGVPSWQVSKSIKESCMHTPGHRFACLIRFCAALTSVLRSQAGMGVGNMAASGANGAGSYTNGFSSATPQNLNDLQNGYLANYSCSVRFSECGPAARHVLAPAWMHST